MDCFEIAGKLYSNLVGLATCLLCVGLYGRRFEVQILGMAVNVVQVTNCKFANLLFMKRQA